MNYQKLPQGEHHPEIKVRVAPRMLELVQKYFQVKHACRSKACEKPPRLSIDPLIELTPPQDPTALFPYEKAKDIVEHHEE